MKPETIKAIESILSKGDRAEVIPTKDGEKVVRIRREVVTGKNMNPNPNYTPPGCGGQTIQINSSR